VKAALDRPLLRGLMGDQHSPICRACQWLCSKVTDRAGSKVASRNYRTIGTSIRFHRERWRGGFRVVFEGHDVDCVARHGGLA
jgi:hypothetical protein